MSRDKKRELRGIQVNPDLHYSGFPYYHKGEQIRDLTVDCHLGSMVLTKDEILDYLEQREINGKLKELYDELIMAVESKFPKETKHETALRYIKDREIKISYSCSADLPVTTK